MVVASVLQAWNKRIVAKASLGNAAVAFALFAACMYVASTTAVKFFTHLYGVPQFDAVVEGVTAASIVSHATAFGDAGCVDYYKMWLPLDTLLPISGTVFFALAISGLAKRNDIPVVAENALFIALTSSVPDLIENLLFAAVCATHTGPRLAPHLTHTIAGVIPMVQSAKWGGIYLVTAVTVLLLLQTLVLAVTGGGKQKRG